MKELVFCIMLASASSKGTTEITKDLIQITCKNDTLDSIEKLNKTQTMSSIHISNCTPPVSYAASLQELNINIANIKELWISLTMTSLEDQLREEQFETLNLKKLGVVSLYKKFRIRYFYEFSTIGKVELSKAKRFDIYCEIANMDLGNLTVVTPIHSTRVDRIQIFDCLVPDNFKDVFQQLNIDFDSGNIEYRLSNTHKTLTLHKSLFARLSVKALTISDYSQGSIIFNEDFFESLVSSLRTMYFRRILLPSLPASSRLKSVTLVEGASMGTLGGCMELKQLQLIRWQVPGVKGGWLSHCLQLEELLLDQLSEEAMQRALTGARMVTVLTIRRCALTHLSDKLLADAVGLQKLTFSELKLSQLDSQAFSSQSRLKTLDLSGNGLNMFWNVNIMLKTLPEIRNLSLAKNPEIGFCRRYYIQNESDQKAPPLLERLSLRQTNLDELCFRQDWDSLSYLDLSANDITDLQFYDLPTPSRGPMEVDLRGNHLRHFPNTIEDYDIMIDKFSRGENLTIWLDVTLNCDCQYAWFARALRNLPRLHVEGANCFWGQQQLKTAPPVWLECDKFPCGDCMCRQAWSDRMIVADCQGVKLRSVPNITHVPNLHMLFASNNQIDKLHEQDFPKRLRVIDFSDNRILHIRPEVLARLFEVPERNVSLAGNPFVCDCDNQPLITSLHEHRKQVMDFDQVTCVGDGEKDIAVRDVDIHSLCSAVRERSLLVLAATVGSLLALIALAIVFLYRYWQELKIFLFARGWCLFCVTENELDADRRYDVFISFAHDDEPFLVEELLPWFELHTDLKFCLHTRDWMPGEPILTQVIRSVVQSRRTVIILSRHFVRSVWAMLEFRTAHVSALQEGRVRVVVIVLDNVVDDQNLDPELVRYLRTNTYLRWGVPRFWDRLRYALPHHGSASDSGKNTRGRRKNSTRVQCTQPGMWTSDGTNEYTK